MYFNIMSFYNSNTFYINKKMQEYLKYYQNNIIQNHIENYNNIKKSSFSLMQSIPPGDPKSYLIVTSITHVLSFLAGYYSYSFLNK